MRKFFVIFLSVILVVLFLVTLFKNALDKNASEPKSIIRIAERGKMIIAVEDNLPGYFTYNDDAYGIQYEMLSRYASYLGVDVEIVPVNSYKSASEELENSDVDLVLAVSDKSGELNALEIHSLDSYTDNRFVVLRRAEKQTPKISSVDSLKRVIGDAEIVLSKPFTACDNYNLWLDSVSNTAMISAEHTEKLIDKLSDGEFDILVCNKFQAGLSMLKHKNIEVLYDFDTDVSSSVYVSKRNEELITDIMKWLFKFGATDEYFRLSELYKPVNFYNQVRRYGYVQPFNSISQYDALIRRACETEGHDWRLVSAIAYSESRFNHSLVSQKGAIGLMQIMPQTARIFNFSIDEVTNDPKANIHVALKLLDEIEKVLRFGISAREYDKMCITLAAYNCGVGHVLDARRLARKYGDNPDKWESVSKYLKKKSEAEYYNDSVVKSGSFRSGETIGFVATVMKCYDRYCANN